MNKVGYAHLTFCDKKYRLFYMLSGIHVARFRESFTVFCQVNSDSESIESVYFPIMVDGCQAGVSSVKLFNLTAASDVEAAVQEDNES